MSAAAADGPQIHPQALCESPNVGERTRVWAFAHVLPGAVIGEDCNICDGVFVENDVVIGDRVTVKCGVQVWDGVVLEDDVFVGPNATFTNDLMPRSRQHQHDVLRTVIEAGASLGANCTVLPGIRVGRQAMVGAGSVVTRPVPPHAIVAGNPARIIGYVDTDNRPGAEPARTSAATSNDVTRVTDLEVSGAKLYELPSHEDLRGKLTAAELPSDIDFPDVRRVFIVHDVPNADVRGEHAHRECHQLLICVSGSVSCLVDDGTSRAVVTLDAPNRALHIPPMVWGSQFRYSADAVLCVLASHPYDAADYLRSYPGFLDEVGGPYSADRR